MKVVQMREVTSISSFPNGTYDGVLSGRKVILSLDNKNYEFYVDRGIMGISPCKVYAVNGIITVKTVS